MSLENRSSSALFKRAEQLKRWQESETNREDIVPKRKTKKIQFSSGVVFLAACAAGDKDEVLRLLRNGADIDTANVDGLTALHQLCIDDNLDMVEFLVENGADVNRGDNEGWTPLHATASCGFVSIAKYLIEHGGNVAAVNNDAELPVDLAETDEMEELLRKILLERGIDCDEARNEEQQMMLADAKEWLNGGLCKDSPHPKTGATALHVAAAKGYIKVISVLLQAGADVNIQDFDGWTPLHAAAHWCQKEVCELLVKNFCDMDIKNCVGQAAFDVADAEMVPVLEELRSKQATMQRDRNDNNAILHKKGINSQKRRMSGADKSNLINKDASSERQLFVDQGTNKVRTVELEIEGSPSEREDTSKIGVNEIDKRNLANRDDISRIPLNSDLSRTVPTTPLTVPLGNEDAPNTGWKRPGSFRNRGPNGREEITNKTTSRIGEKDTSHKGTTQTGTNIRGSGDPSDVVLRRTQSFEDEGRSREEDSSIGAKDTPSTTTSTVNTVVTTTTTSTTSPSATSPLPNSQVRSPSKGSVATVPSTPTSPGGSKLSPGNIFKNFFKSFVPPVRDEESETQRKAHAKRVRETRRSTQGVTLEEIKTAEQLVKKKNQQLQANQNTNTNSTSSDQFLLEDARSRSSVNEVPTTTTSYIRRPPPLHLPARPASAPIEPASPSPDTTVTVALRRQTKPPDDKDQDKENDIRNAQATQAVIQRRRRPKRRSTGIPVDVDDADSERQDSLAGGDSDGASLRDRESGGDWSGTSRLSNSPGGDSQLDSQNYGSNSSRSSKEVNENGEIDYKKLYEASVVENERLRDKLKKTEDDLVEARNQIDKHPVASSKNSLSEMEKRERRAMERKLSEMEEELKQLQKLKAENERLKAENRALTRVVSKITNSAHATK